jgi:hypothetical protein
MLNRKQAHIPLLYHNKIDCRKYLRLSFEIDSIKEKKKTKKAALFNMFKSQYKL